MVRRGKKTRLGELGCEETNVISRLWHGWTTRDNADAYEELLRSEILPGIHRVAGFKGALLLRRDGKDEVEFVTLTMFDIDGGGEGVRRRGLRSGSDLT